MMVNTLEACDGHVQFTLYSEADHVLWINAILCGSRTLRVVVGANPGMIWWPVSPAPIALNTPPTTMQCGKGIQC
jgi:hypothetical protein